MPSDRRGRSRSRSRSRNRSRNRSRDHSQEGSDTHASLPHDASPISESDYFRKGDEFRIWLKDEKKKVCLLQVHCAQRLSVGAVWDYPDYFWQYFDELSGDKARSYFRKFVKAWNKGKLPKSLYAGVDPSSISAESQTGYKWSFASNKSRVDNDALRAARESVGAATWGRQSTSTGASSSSAPGPSRIQGPTLPSSSDLVYARELARETEQEDRSLKRKRDKAEAKERIEDMVGPREVGREGALEKKRARREADRSFRERGDDGMEADESVLLGGGDSFKAQIAKRDAARSRRDQKYEDKTAAVRERANEYKEKESKTMAMFAALAKERFG
ncbi:hypothetical protein MVEN_01502300 [Mycena venus]|uniref:Splicing arginine serine-rich 12 n=1 Tax=Mycena venus TaxID=2733690 RepID=A0A8H6XSV3_9AGAR|nr:hypothetical protein MVEN_01502300 [Mycena venus]